MHALRGTVWTVAIVGAIAFQSCSAANQSLDLSLALRPGLTYTTQTSIEERIAGEPALQGSKNSHVPALPRTFSTWMTYRFSVESVSSEGIAKVKCDVLGAGTSQATQAEEDYLQSLQKSPSTLYLDRTGRLVGIEGAPFPGAAIGNGPAIPGAGNQANPAVGDVESLFGGMNGERVSLGSSWTTSIAPDQAQGMAGTLVWTVESIARTTAGLAFQGDIEDRKLSIPGLPRGVVATISGKIRGFLTLERDTRWPIQGKTSLSVRIFLPGDAAHGVKARQLAAMQIVTLYDPVEQ